MTSNDQEMITKLAGLPIRTKAKAGGALTQNHNQTLPVRTAVKAGIIVVCKSNQ